MRRPCFFEDDHVGLASIASTEAGSSGSQSNSSSNNGSNPFFTRSRKSSSYRSLSSLSSSASSNSNTSSPRSTRFYESRCKELQLPHFLESCALCKKPLGDNRDIFMYRGDTPFCSEECREEQIEIDEAKEKNWKFTSSMTTIRKEKQSKSTPNKSQNYQVGTICLGFSFYLHSSVRKLFSFSCLNGTDGDEIPDTHEIFLMKSRLKLLHLQLVHLLICFGNVSDNKGEQ